MNESLNRAFMYGESVFTTMRMVNDSVRDWESHFDRLKRGIEFVFGPFADEADWEVLLRNRLETRTFSEKGDKVLRLTVYRERARGVLRTGLINVSDLKIHISASPYEPHRSEGKSLRLRSCASTMRPHWWPSYLKAGSYLETILAQKVSLKPEDDDLLFLSHEDTVLSSSVANIFIVRHNKLYTPPTGPNVLEGIMRGKILQLSHEYFDDVFETETNMEQLYKADAVFGTNSIRGPFLISHIDGREYRADANFFSKFEEMRKRVMG